MKKTCFIVNFEHLNRNIHKLYIKKILGAKYDISQKLCIAEFCETKNGFVISKIWKKKRNAIFARCRLIKLEEPLSVEAIE